MVRNEIIENDVSRVRARSNFFLIVLAVSCLCSLIQLYSLPYKKAALISLSNRAILFTWFIGIGFTLFKRLTRPIPAKASGVFLVLFFSLLSLLIADSCYVTWIMMQTQSRTAALLLRLSRKEAWTLCVRLSKIYITAQFWTRIFPQKAASKSMCRFIWKNQTHNVLKGVDMRG